jgi:hypothetical protein
MSIPRRTSETGSGRHRHSIYPQRDDRHSGMTPQVELVRVELFRTPTKLHPLQLANQLAQSVVLVGEPPVLGPLGVALGPGRQHQDQQRGNVVGKSVGRPRTVSDGRASAFHDDRPEAQ